LKASGSFCGKLLSAQSRHQRKPDQVKCDAAADKQRGSFAVSCDRKIEAAERTGFTYNGQSIGDMSDKVEVVAERIADAVNGQ
jgi:hypothetical protein